MSSNMTLSGPNTIYNLELWLLLLILRKQLIICWVFHQIKSRPINSNHFYGSVYSCHGLSEQYHTVYAAYPHRNRFTFGTFHFGDLLLLTSKITHHRKLTTHTSNMLSGSTEPAMTDHFIDSSFAGVGVIALHSFLLWLIFTMYVMNKIGLN